MVRRSFCCSEMIFKMQNVSVVLIILSSLPRLTPAERNIWRRVQRDERNRFGFGVPLANDLYVTLEIPGRTWVWIERRTGIAGTWARTRPSTVISERSVVL